MCIEASKPGKSETNGSSPSSTISSSSVTTLVSVPAMSREEMFDRHYFDGGRKVGGYAREGYWDFPVHELTFRHILERRPESVIELGSARGYIVKRLQDYGIRAQGIDISNHCYLTRACEDLIKWDLCKVPWPLGTKEFDLCVGVAILEHLPEEHLSNVFREITRVSRRGLFGISFDPMNEGDRTRCTIYPKEWWVAKLVNEEHEVVLKSDLERGQFPETVLRGDGKVKLNIGSLNLMFHHGWINIDVLDISEFAQANQFNFTKLDVRTGLPYSTGMVDLIYTSHCLEHLTYSEGLSFLRECRRVIKPNGAMRVLVPDAKTLINRYEHNTLSDLDEINNECAEASLPAKKLWSLLYDNHKAIYDEDTLSDMFKDSGWVAKTVKFREGHPHILREVIESFPCLSLTMEAAPHIA